MTHFSKNFLWTLYKNINPLRVQIVFNAFYAPQIHNIPQNNKKHHFIYEKFKSARPNAHNLVIYFIYESILLDKCQNIASHAENRFMSLNEE